MSDKSHFTNVIGVYANHSWQTDQQLRQAYELYRGALALDAGDTPCSDRHGVGLAASAEEWPLSAARVQYLRDGLARAAASKGDEHAACFSLTACNKRLSEEIYVWMTVWPASSLGQGGAGFAGFSSSTRAGTDH